METTDWHGGLRDRALMPGRKQQMLIEPAVRATIDAVKRNVFPLHGL